MQKLLSISAAVVGLSFSSAHAGNVEPVEVAPAVMASPAVVDWSGAYIGGLASFSTGTQVESYDDGEEISGDLTYDLEGTMYGGFAGYNVQRGSYVYGVEAAYMVGAIDSTGYSATGGISDWTIYDLNYKSLADVKARVGIAAGNALIFAFVGGSTGQFEYSDDGEPLPGSHTATGLNYGAGVDFMVSDRFFVGAEYIVRDMTADIEAEGWLIEDINIQSIQVRAGIKF